jgi:hypothetical protein
VIANSGGCKWEGAIFAVAISLRTPDLTESYAFCLRPNIGLLGYPTNRNVILLASRRLARANDESLRLRIALADCGGVNLDATVM